MRCLVVILIGAWSLSSKQHAGHPLKAGLVSQISYGRPILQHFGYLWILLLDKMSCHGRGKMRMCLLNDIGEHKSPLGCTIADDT